MEVRDDGALEHRVAAAERGDLDLAVDAGVDHSHHIHHVHLGLRLKRQTAHDRCLWRAA